ncbi:MAG: signal peptidase II [Trebonia sp.]|uniref:signal peptidase II n=1 Tax=Trebonia sp. TaxID=2767075 RepID=UPI003BB215AD
MAVVPAGSAARGRAVRWAMLGTAAVVLAADQITKSLVLRLHPVTGSGLVSVRLVRNTGASGGIAAGYPVLVTLAAVAIVAVAGTLAVRTRSRAVAICLAAVLGGALGNLSDRLFRAPGLGRGAVVDWIHVAGRGGSFNISDLAIQLGAVAAVVAMFTADRARVRRPDESWSK